MKLASWLLLAAILVACASPARTPPAASATPAAPAATSSAVPSASSVQTAIDLLDCDGAPSTVGGADAGMAMEGGAGGATPDEALAEFLANTLFVVPHDGYVPLGTSGDRFAYGYLVEDDVKVVAVFSPRHADVIGAAYALDELRACAESEFGSEAEFNDDRRVWTHAETGAILTDLPGPSHCGWQSARIMHVEADGVPVKQYLRDPDGVFTGIPLMDSYGEGVALPGDAADSGYRSPEGFELWFTDADTAAFVVTPVGVERWPRPVDLIGCA